MSDKNKRAAPEPFFAFTDEHGELLSRLFGPAAGQPASGPPYTHVLSGPDPDDEEADEAMARLFRPYTITRDSE